MAAPVISNGEAVLAEMQRSSLNTQTVIGVVRRGLSVLPSLSRIRGCAPEARGVYTKHVRKEGGGGTEVAVRAAKRK